MHQSEFHPVYVIGIIVCTCLSLCIYNRRSNIYVLNLCICNKSNIIHVFLNLCICNRNNGIHVSEFMYT